MGIKSDLLSKLDENKLKKIAKKEGLTKIPANYGKRDLVKYLDGVLTLQEVKSYTIETYEKETNREIIRETIKEKGARQRFETKETAQLELGKADLILKLTENKEKIDKSVLEAMANYMHESIPNGSGYSLYKKMSEKFLERLYRVFVEKETDGKGRYLEYRFANFIKNKSTCDIARLKIRYDLPKVGEIDVLGFDSDDKPVFIAECKDRPVKYEDIDKWISNVKRAYSEYGGSLTEAYFVGSAGYTDGTIKRLEDSNEINPKKGYVSLGGKAFIKDFLLNDRSTSDSGKVFIKVYDVRGNQFLKILPRAS